MAPRRLHSDAAWLLVLLPGSLLSRRSIPFVDVNDVACCRCAHAVLAVRYRAGITNDAPPGGDPSAQRRARRGVTTSPLRMHVDRSVARKEAKSQRRLARFARAAHTPHAGETSRRRQRQRQLDARDKRRAREHRLETGSPAGGGGGGKSLGLGSSTRSGRADVEARQRCAAPQHFPQHFVLARRSRVVEGSVKLVPAQQAAPLYCALCLIKFMSTQGKHCARTRVVQWRRGSGGRGRAGRGGSGQSGI